MRNRRTDCDLDEILEGCIEVIEDEGQVTLRHLFYKLVGMDLLEKTEAEYSKLSKYTMVWRRSGELDWFDFVDSSRWYHGARLYDTVEECMRVNVLAYRRNLWATQNYYVEIWVEKEAVAAIAQQTAEPFGVPVFAMKGFPSGTALANIARTLGNQRENGKEVKVYYLGDHDPSGLKIQDKFLENLRVDFECEFDFSRLAITPQQIKLYDLPTRPTKTSDPNSAKFVGESVEVDALDNSVIGELLTNAITQNIRGTEWQYQKNIEELERESAMRLLGYERKGKSVLEKLSGVSPDD